MGSGGRGQRATERARGVDVGGRGNDVVGDLRRELVDHAGDRSGVHVGDDHLGTVCDEQLHEFVSDLAEPLDADRTTRESRLAPDRLRSGAHGLEDTECGQR